jgi:hypothetical protein
MLYFQLRCELRGLEGQGSEVKCAMDEPTRPSSPKNKREVDNGTACLPGSPWTSTTVGEKLSTQARNDGGRAREQEHRITVLYPVTSSQGITNTQSCLTRTCSNILSLATPVGSLPLLLVSPGGWRRDSFQGNFCVLSSWCFLPAALSSFSSCHCTGNVAS